MLAPIYVEYVFVFKSMRREKEKKRELKKE